MVETKKLKTITAQLQIKLLNISQLKMSTDKCLCQKSVQNLFFCRYNHENILDKLTPSTLVQCQIFLIIPLPQSIDAVPGASTSI